MQSITEQDRNTRAFKIRNQHHQAKKVEICGREVINYKGKTLYIKECSLIYFLNAIIELLTEGDKKTGKWVAENYSEVTQKVVNTFVFLCRFQAEEKPITTRVKPVVLSPFQPESFL